MVRVGVSHSDARTRMKLINSTGYLTSTTVGVESDVYGAGPMLEHPSTLEQSRNAIQGITGVIVILNGVRNIG